MCREKGLDTLVEAFIILKERNRVKNLKLKDRRAACWSVG